MNKDSFKNNSKTLVALVPVIHSLYLDLFKKYPDDLYIVGESILEDWEEYHKMSRDLRRIDQKQMANFIQKSNLFKKVTVLEKENIEELIGKEIVMPREDVSEWVAEKYFPNQSIIYENIFLRWNRPVSTQEKEISPDRIISEEKFHQEMMKKAEALSQKSANWWRQIGVLAIKDNKIIAESFNRHVPTQQNMAVYGDLRMCFDAGEHHELSNSIHGEASLIAQCAKKGVSLEGSELYVTVYPCPTCAKLIAESGIKRIFYKSGYSLSDAEEILKSAGVEIVLVRLTK